MHVPAMLFLSIIQRSVKDYPTGHKVLDEVLSCRSVCVCVRVFVSWYLFEKGSDCVTLKNSARRMASMCDRLCGGFTCTHVGSGVRVFM